MAYLPSNSLICNQWVICDIGDDICIIENPGLDDEKVHFRFNGRSKNDITKTLNTIYNTDVLDQVQKHFASFWIGYFYAHMTRPQGWS